MTCGWRSRRSTWTGTRVRHGLGPQTGTAFGVRRRRFWRQLQRIRVGHSSRESFEGNGGEPFPPACDHLFNRGPDSAELCLHTGDALQHLQNHKRFPRTRLSPDDGVDFQRPYRSALRASEPDAVPGSRHGLARLVRRPVPHRCRGKYGLQR